MILTSSMINENAIKFSEWLTLISGDSLLIAKLRTDLRSLMRDFGIIREKSELSDWGTLYSESLKLSVPTKTNCSPASDFFVFIKTQVRTGEKLFSVTA